ncbi:MAG: phosphomethylpyrimidine synthase ThiC [Desulfobacterales bacterium]|nr:phosphomethylpyrimidine synthase ThiC [Desulfobacterales bacterium]MDD4073837.1 phosphomethylpyrimidine synthase ThiC [Desulfobacterales bacterium]MDD4393382.1 phosphomethylpyrimidine synthase ThiC [Desulfobacterales bacterium]
MSTVIDELKQGGIPEFVRKIAADEAIDPQQLIDDILNGYVVVSRNNRHTEFDPIGIGKGTRIKVNANIGTSPTQCDFSDEIVKVKAAIDSGADAVMDLSIAGDISGFRQAVTSECNITLGTVPIYEAMIGLDNPAELTIDRFLDVVRKQAEEKVDFMTIHAGLLQKHIPLADHRQLGVVSRGGSIMVNWMRHHREESFLYRHFDEILKIAYAYDITMSLGDGLRPGCTADANDAAQFGELEVLGELVQRCRDANVQVMVEGPGHVPLHLIEENIRKQKTICNGAPFYVLGPLVIDYAAGYDHIAGAIGGALAAYFGADFLCYLTPAEHLRLPDIDDVREGVIASKIAAAAVDLSRKNKKEVQRNLEISQARKDFNWDAQQKLSIDPVKFEAYVDKVKLDESKNEEHACSMCGQWCAIRRARENQGGSDSGKQHVY